MNEPKDIPRTVHDLDPIIWNQLGGIDKIRGMKIGVLAK